MTQLNIVFKKYEDFLDVSKHMLRATAIVIVLYKIDRNFANKYLHKYNPLIFTSFLRDVLRVQKAIKRIHNIHWEQLLNGVKEKKSKVYLFWKYLNICEVELAKKTCNRVKFWKRVQENSSIFINM